MKTTGLRWRHPGLLAALLLGALTAPPADAQEPESSGGEAPVALRVGIKEAPPFAIRGPDGEWSGIAVELWTSVAASLGRPFTFEERELVDPLLDDLERGALDVAVGALTVTQERERRLDFSHPFYSSGLGIAVATGQVGEWSGGLSRLFSLDFLRALGALLLVLVITGAAMWALERRRSPDQFGGGALRGIGEGVWWSAVTMTTVGYGDRTPHSLAGRVLALVWMFASVITISGFTAAIASTLTIGQLGPSIQGPQDLPRFRIGAVNGTTGEGYLDSRGITRRVYPSVVEALEALGQGRVDAVVHDAPILRYLIRQQLPDLRVLPSVFAQQEYALAVGPASSLREPVSLAVLGATDQDRWLITLRQYLGEP